MTASERIRAARETAERLEYLRGELRAERISYGELAELQDLGESGRIPADDLELREAAGLPEHNDDDLTGADIDPATGEIVPVQINADSRPGTE